MQLPPQAWFRPKQAATLLGLLTDDGDPDVFAVYKMRTAGVFGPPKVLPGTATSIVIPHDALENVANGRAWDEPAPDAAAGKPVKA